MAWIRSNRSTASVPGAGRWSLGGWVVDAGIAVAITVTVLARDLNASAMAGRWPPPAAELAVQALRAVSAFVVSFAVARCVSLGHRSLVARRSSHWPWLLALWLGTAVSAGWLAAAVGLLRIADHSVLEWRPWHPWVGMSFRVWLPESALLVLLHEATWRSRRRVAQLHAAELARLTLQGELAEARAQLLRAHVEPHFLFNALANASQLLKTDAAAARHLLRELMRYLEEALPRLRSERSTLAREGELVRAYLAVFQVRMGPRLKAELDLPAELLGCEVPPLTLLTLVENAIRHGLQPLVEGGSITVSARADGDKLQLVVADTGRGMGSGLGDGSGLTNLRARLRSAFGAEAGLALRVNDTHGLVATVTLPLRVA